MVYAIGIALFIGVVGVWIFIKKDEEKSSQKSVSNIAPNMDMDEFRRMRLANLEKERRKNIAQEKMNDYAELMKNIKAAELADPNNQLTEEDVIPEGIGEFGFDMTNPIPCATVPDSYYYLDNLTKDGIPVTYNRLGSFRVDNIKKPIDGYDLFVNEEKVGTIYISAYHLKNSFLAPEGFELTF